MANVTDPLARCIHGTNPQNLIEYITRQRIYDSQYWKEECFGLTATDVAEKAAIQLQAIGGTYGGNGKPTRFLCLVLKMLQIQPDESIVDELICNEDFKYVRALGAFYLRLTGRPAEIYEKLEPLYNDYRRVRLRNPTDWSLIHVDEFADSLLRDDRVCGIAMPRLPKREVLTEGGYLDGPRISAMSGVLFESAGGDEGSGIEIHHKEGIARALKVLGQMASDGNEFAKAALDKRRVRLDQEIAKSEQRTNLELTDTASNAKEYPIEKEAESAYSQVNVTGDKSTRDRSRSRSRSWGRRSRRDEITRGHHSEDNNLTKRSRHPDERESKKLKRQGERYDSRHRHYGEQEREDTRHSGSRDSHRYSNNHLHKEKKKEKRYGSLFKSSDRSKDRMACQSPLSKEIESENAHRKSDELPDQGSEEYWNDQRAKLGLKPLKK